MKSACAVLEVCLVDAFVYRCLQLARVCFVVRGCLGVFCCLNVKFGEALS
jgi:hypothetical protein